MGLVRGETPLVASESKDEVHCQKDDYDESIIEEPNETGVWQEQRHQVRRTGGLIGSDAVRGIEEDFHHSDLLMMDTSSRCIATKATGSDLWEEVYKYMDIPQYL